MKSILKKACSLCLAAILLCSAVPTAAVAEDLMIDSKPPVVSSEPMNIQPWANGELLLEVPDLATATKNQETGAIYTQAFGNESFYTYNTEKGTMNSLAVGGSATTVSYGGKTNLMLNEKSKYTVSYLATTTSVAGGGGLRISYASNSSSIGFYAHAGGEKGCLAWGANTTNGYSGYKSYTKDMKKRGTVYQHDGFAKFDIEIDGFVISGYLNDVLCFRENIQAPSNASAKSGIANDYMSETLTLVWSEYVSADQTAGTPSTEIKDLKIYAGLLHQEVYDLSVIGMQVGTTADGKRNVRFVAGGNTDTYAEAGMEITAILDSGERLMFQYETSQVARKLTTPQADLAIDAITAAEVGSAYLFGYLLTGIPDDENIRLTVKPYLLSDGTRMYGAEASYTLGDFPLILEESGESMVVHFPQFGFEPNT